MTVCSQLQKVYTIYAHRLTDNFMITHLSWWWEDSPWGSHARNYNVNCYLLQTECLHSDSSHAPWRLNLIGWSWATSERRETWAEKYQRGRTGGPRDCVLMERTGKTTDCRGRQNGRKSSCTRKFFFTILWKCKQQAWNSSYMILYADTVLNYIPKYTVLRHGMCPGNFQSTALYHCQFSLVSIYSCKNNPTHLLHCREWKSDLSVAAVFCAHVKINDVTSSHVTE